MTSCLILHKVSWGRLMQIQLVYFGFGLLHRNMSQPACCPILQTPCLIKYMYKNIFLNGFCFIKMKGPNYIINCLVDYPVTIVRAIK